MVRCRLIVKICMVRCRLDCEIPEISGGAEDEGGSPGSVVHHKLRVLGDHLLRYMLEVQCSEDSRLRQQYS